MRRSVIEVSHSFYSNYGDLDETIVFLAFWLDNLEMYVDQYGKPREIASSQGFAYREKSIKSPEADSARMGDVIDILRKHKLMLMPIRTGHTTMANAKAYVRHLHGLRRARSPRRS